MSNSKGKLMHKQEYTVRNAFKNEFQEIGKLMVDVYTLIEGFPKQTDKPEYYEMLANVEKFTKYPKTEILVAVSLSDKIAGAVVYFGDMLHYNSPGIATKEPTAAGFRLLAVDGAFRGKGIGKLLASKCIEKAKNEGAKQVIIHTTKAMQTAWKMYEHLGFSRSTI